MRAVVMPFLALFLVISPVMAEQEGEEKPAPATLEELQGRIAEVLEETETPGVGLSLVNRDEVLWSGGVGVADRETGEPVTADTVFRIGSITKSFVALTALMLVEEGLLDLDTPLRELAPEIEFDNPWRDTDPVRFVHLLEHTTGWDDIALRDYAHNVKPPISLREALDYNPKTRHSRWRPGTSMSYCNAGPAVAAYVIQKITGREFEQYVRERLFLPLDMNIADFQKSPAVTERLATGYNGDDPVDYWNITMRPAGSINTSAREMAGFVQLFLNRGSVGEVTLLRPESIDRMEVAQTTRAARAGVQAGYGLHNYSTISDGVVFHGHNGGMDGYLAEMAYLPNHGLGYAFMINAANGETLVEISKLVRQYLTLDLEPDLKTPAARIETASLQSHEGWYEPITPRVEKAKFLARLLGLVRVESTDQVLELHPLLGESEKLVPVSNRLFRREDDPIASVVFYDGDANGIALMGMGHELRRVSSLLVWLQLLLGAASLLLMVSALLFALIWIPRRLFGKKLKGAPHMSIRALPALTAALFAAAIVVLMLSLDNAIPLLGKPTFWSVSFLLLTWLFAVISVWALVQVVRHRSVPINRGVRIHSMLVSIGAMTVMLYLLYWGVIGWRTWA